MNIEKLEKEDTILSPTLKDRNPRNSNVDEMKQVVREYLNDILVIDDNINIFYQKIQKGILEPELLLEDKEIIKKYPMIMWKLKR